MTLSRRRRPPRSVPAVVSAIVAVTVLAGCGSDEDVPGGEGPAASLSEAELTGGEGRDLAAEQAAPLEGGVIVDDSVPSTTVPIAGSAAELLPEIGVEMSRLSAVLGTAEGIATIDRINGMWAAIRDEVATQRPDLVNGIQTTVDLANSAVEANRPADADAAFEAVSAHIDDFTGDS